MGEIKLFIEKRWISIIYSFSNQDNIVLTSAEVWVHWHPAVSPRQQKCFQHWARNLRGQSGCLVCYVPSLLALLYAIADSYMLYAMCYMLYAICYMLYAICAILAISPANVLPILNA